MLLKVGQEVHYIRRVHLVSMCRALAAVLSPTIWRGICPPVVSASSASPDVVLQAVVVVVVIASGQDVFVWRNYPLVSCVYSDLPNGEDLAYREREEPEYYILN